MTTITYLDGHGDTITDYPTVDVPGGRVHLAHNATGWRLIPPSCRPGCPNPPVWLATRTLIGTFTRYCCDDHLPPWARAAIEADA